LTPRHQAREAALQILYFCAVSHAEPSEAIDAFFAEHLPEAGEAVRTFASELVHGTLAGLADLDGLIVRYAENWRLERIALVDRQILRLAAWELRHHDEDTPPAAVINEALELARTFSGDEAVPFVNGVLDGIRKSLDVDREVRGPVS
jgi:N utilization substance protein B